MTAAPKPTETGPPRPPASPPAQAAGRKPWKKKTSVEVVLEQIGKQEKKVAEMERALAQERRELEKLQAARKVLEAK